MAAFIYWAQMNRHSLPEKTPQQITPEEVQQVAATPHANPTPPPLKVTKPTLTNPQALPTKAAPALESQTQKDKMANIRSQVGANAVEFTVHNGMAIAFGDVMLGKVLEGNTMKQGYYNAPNPQTWDRHQIAYIISPDLPNPQRVQKAIDYFNEHTPIQFVAYQNHRDALIFEKGSEHCYSYLGRIGGIQPITLAAGCQWQEITHEIMHALGFIHEQSRADRDQYIDVLWENIEEKFKPQFAQAPEAFMEAMKGSDFDYKSLMLYQPHDFSIRPDLLALRSKNDSPIAPTRDGLSEGDIKRLQRLYGVH